MRTLDMDHLAKYGMDRFGVWLTIERVDCDHSDKCPGAHITNLETFPVEDKRTKHLIAEMLGRNLNDVLGSFELIVDSTGAFRSEGNGIKDEPVFRTLLLRGRDRYFEALEEMYNPETLNERMEAVAMSIIEHDLPLARVEPVILPHDQFGFSRLNQHITVLTELVDPESGRVAVPGAISSLPGDFQAEFNENRLNNALAMIGAAMKRVLPKTKESLTARLERLNRLETELA